MHSEQSFFRKATVDFSRLIPYGFRKNADHYIYSKTILNGDFRVDVIISAQGEVSGRVFDLLTESEYANVHIGGLHGEFVHSVREAYFDVLQDILSHCFIQRYFISPQANRLAEHFVADYGERPLFLWEKHPDFAVFRHRENDKWYALIMHIDKNKLVKKSKGAVDVVNFKIEAGKLESLLKEKGVYPAYHMNKKNWISVILDDTLPDERIFRLARQSYDLTMSSKARQRKNGRISKWLIPANPKYYDVEGELRERAEIDWKQSTDIAVGDVVYMYVAAPRSAILYKFEVTAVNLPNIYTSAHVNIKRLMKIRLLKQLSPEQMPLDKMKEFGVKGVRGPRSIPAVLSDYIDAL